MAPGELCAGAGAVFRVGVGAIIDCVSDSDEFYVPDPSLFDHEAAYMQFTRYATHLRRLASRTGSPQMLRSATLRSRYSQRVTRSTCWTSCQS